MGWDHRPDGLTLEIKQHISLPIITSQFISINKLKKWNELRNKKFHNWITLALTKWQLVLTETIAIKYFNLLYFHEIFPRL